MPSGLETLGQGHRGENRNVYTLTQADDVPWYLPSAGIISLWQKNTCGNCAELPLRMTFSQSVATREHAWMLIMAMISYEEQAVFDLYAFACACVYTIYTYYMLQFNIAEGEFSSISASLSPEQISRTAQILAMMTQFLLL